LFDGGLRVGDEVQLFHRGLRVGGLVEREFRPLAQFLYFDWYHGLHPESDTERGFFGG
jgi:hypothetical protein